MIWFFVLLFLCLALLLWLPIQVEIDTDKDLYRINWSVIFSFWVVPGENRWHWFYKLFFWKWELDWGTKQLKKEKKVEKKASQTQKRKFRISMKRGLAFFQHMMQAIKIQYLKIDWDTGDFLLNAWLYPAFHLVQRDQRQLHINFMGLQTIALRLQTRLGALALAVLRVFINSKTK